MGWTNVGTHLSQEGQIKGLGVGVEPGEIMERQL